MGSIPAFGSDKNMKNKLEFSEAARKIKPGIYEHYKGNKYVVLAVGRHSETLEELVVYQSQYGDFGIWARPLKIFVETVKLAKKEIPRFKYLSDK